MAHIDHSFQMSGDPEAAQALFMRDVTPDLAKETFFHVVSEEPGELVFDDALSPDEDDPDLDAEREAAKVGDEEELSDLPAPAKLWPSESSVGQRMITPFPIGVSQDVLARHLRVEFTPGDGGTIVRMRGHVRKNLKVALERFGSQGHWPETADRPHD